MTKNKAIAETLKAAGTSDRRVALQALISSDRFISDMVTFDWSLPRRWFDGMPAERYAGMDDAQVDSFLLTVHDAIA